MATASVTNTFVASTAAEAAEVNTNFTNLVTFLNNSVVHVDGSKAMTTNFDVGSHKIINLTSPTSGTDAANKTYVDAAVISASNQVATGEIADNAVTSAKIEDAIINRINAIPMVQSGVIEAGTITSGVEYSVNFPAAFGAGGSNIRLTFGSYEDQYMVAAVKAGSVTTTGFSVFIAPVPVAAGGSGSTIVRVAWTAVGTWPSSI